MPRDTVGMVHHRQLDVGDVIVVLLFQIQIAVHVLVIVVMGAL